MATNHLREGSLERNERQKSNSIRAELALVLPLVFYQVGVVFTIVWILLLENWMNTASVLAITMRMIHLSLAGLQEATAQLWNAIRRAYVHIECVELVRNGQVAFGVTEVITLDLVRWPNKESEVL